MKKIAKVLAIVVLGVLALGLFGGSESCAPKEEATTTAPVATVAVPVAPIEPVAPVGIAPCTDGTQESCTLYWIVYGNLPADASVAYLDCVATYMSSTYTADQFIAADTVTLALEAIAACGQPN